MAADLTLYIDVSRGIFVQGPATLQPLVSLPLIQAEEINVGVQMLSPTGNGLAPYVNLDPSLWAMQFALGYIDATGTKQLIALSTGISGASSLTAISGISAQTAFAFPLVFGPSAASALLGSVHSSPIWAEAGWNPTPTAATAYLNKAQIRGKILTGYLGVGLPAPS